ncbi:hypothetical protein BDY21DRAFT_338846 [Lineolata rhizophorae]|uniref:Swiss Army Knife RNA repair protein HAD domain-containing protein n=1 Tax=Lineolata rhizophorae TaxID=578093 RepID=A0A6A6P724_9PEZI|nr:hypothetical protein BDY21DRAFT_338846 [Lineolata rhizophorae]
MPGRLARILTASLRLLPTSATAMGTPNSPPVYSLTRLKRWSWTDHELPPVERIKAIHVYDFDNTLFASPLPNRDIWHGSAIGKLSSPDALAGGGWWHCSAFLAATGRGAVVEEKHAWQGWWNEQMVKLVRMSADQKEALSVMLTGRAEPEFARLIRRMTQSKGLDFDMFCLKPGVGPLGQNFNSTIDFKVTLLKDIMCTYKNADEIRVYEDRQRQCVYGRSQCCSSTYHPSALTSAC